VIDRGPGDLLRAISELDVEHWDDASRMLGFSPAESDLDETALGVAADADELRAPSVTADLAMPLATVADAELTLAARPVSRTIPTDVGDVAWLAEVPPLPHPGAAVRASGLRHEPLLDSRREAALLAELVATTMLRGRPDIGQMIRVVTTRRQIRAIPRRPRPTLAHGVQVLVDLGLGLRPFVRDRQDIEAALRRVVGSTVTVGWFMDDLANGVCLPGDDDLMPYEPAAGVPVLLISDLGIGGQSARTRWLRVEQLVKLSDRVRSQGSFVCALVPYSRPRWPVGLARRMAVVQWDRRATMATVRAARRAVGADRVR
jgi:hypothetical protein